MEFWTVLGLSIGANVCCVDGLSHRETFVSFFLGGFTVVLNSGEHEAGSRPQNAWCHAPTAHGPQIVPSHRCL